jgi:hypothetical protein
MAASSSTSRISISYRGTTYPLSLPADSTLLDLQHELETLTSVHPPQQKLLYKGKTTVAKDDPQTVTLAQAGLRDGVKVQMLGVTSQELSSLKAAEEQHHKRERVLHERALKKPVKVSSCAPFMFVCNERCSSLGLVYGIQQDRSLHYFVYLPAPRTTRASPQLRQRARGARATLQRPRHPTRHASTPVLRRPAHRARPARAPAASRAQRECGAGDQTQAAHRRLRRL